MNYRIYENICGWNLSEITNNTERMVAVVENMINNGVNQFLVIEHNIVEDYDFPIIMCERDLIDFKEEIKGTNKRLVK